MNDFYETLQVHPKADQAAIEAAYNRLQTVYDPARIEGAADELVELARKKRDEIERAYAVLSNERRRATYDAELAQRAEPEPEDEEFEEELDFRPLPPAQKTERPKGFESRLQRTNHATARRAKRNTTPLVFSAILLGVIVIGTASFLFSGATPGTLIGAAPTTAPTASPVDQFEGIIAQAKARADAAPNNPQVWVDYGNYLYDSVQVVRELQPDSVLYQQRVPRWLQATEAYSRALALDPENASVRADLGASSCFYGTGTSDQQYVVSGLREAQKAAEALPNDGRVQLSLGHCFASTEPPRIEEALEAWLKVTESQPAESPLAQQAQLLIDQYTR